MNKIVNVSIIMLVMTSILGCNNNSDLKEAANQSQSGNAAPQKVQVQESGGRKSFDSSIYYVLESDPIIQTSYKQIVWKEGDVVLTATISKAEGEQALQSNTVISSITVESNNGVHTIELDKKPLGIQSVDLSKNNQLAVHVRDHEGSRLIILSLSGGKQSVLNNLPNEVGFSEKIDSYNWSPDGKTLAFGMGSIGSSYIALYNTEDNTLSNLSDKDYRLITSVVWHKNGEGFDFLSKTDDDKNPVILYQYLLKEKLITKVTGTLSENEQKILTTKFLPKKIE
ncbi:protein tolB [Paenibacillus rhizoplanae]|uniref:Protein tolB n=1 Tax=Paenibacillus rhizoplanae TaxID=1917181 RepID=A0ABW5F4C9_9BACL